MTVSFNSPPSSSFSSYLLTAHIVTVKAAVGLRLFWSSVSLCTSVGDTWRCDGGGGGDSLLPTVSLLVYFTGKFGQCAYLQEVFYLFIYLKAVV